MAKYHDVWVLTRRNNRPAIEAALARAPVPGLRFIYYDWPGWARWWKRGQIGIQVYYYLWQAGAYFVARNFHRAIGFDLVHHVTFVKYWTPSFLALLPIPFIWGPVGGGDSTPGAFKDDLPTGGRFYEIFREACRWCGERDPFVRLTARRSAIAFAATDATAQRLTRLGAQDVRMVSQIGLARAEIRRLSQRPAADAGPVKFVSIGRALALKGVHLGLRAFARARFFQAEYWVIGDGPELGRLKALARTLGIADSVRFFGWLPRDTVLGRLAEADVLVHPSLHDSGAWVCAEALAIGRPVICLDLGGPAVQVTDLTGFKIRPRTPEQVVRDLSTAMRRLEHEPGLRRRMGLAGYRRCMEALCWESKGELLDTAYWELVEPRRTRVGASPPAHLPDEDDPRVHQRLIGQIKEGS
jgi:glycosyltransferase involved in cell wall biosynthesis